MTSPATPGKVKVWDLPVRLAHWLLLGLVGFSWWSGEQGGDQMVWHSWSGYAILTLVVFRIGWGFIGSDSARFASFVRGPRASFAYLRSVLKRQPKAYLGHNPLGGWMIMALLLVLLVQVVTGLLGNDDSDYEAPLAHWISHDTSSLVSALHGYSFDLLLILLGLHVAAVLTHVVLQRDDMLKAMFTGVKTSLTGDNAGQMASNWRALSIVAVVVLGVYALVSFG
jgi:cytochrome b